MKKRKINLVDVAVLIIFLMLIAGAIYKFAVINKENHTATETIENKEYVVYVRGIRQPTVDGVHKGDSYFDSKTNTFMGKVTEIRVEPFTTMMLTDDNQYKKVEKIGYYNLYLTIEGPILDKEKGYFVDGKVELKRNSSLNIYSKYLKTGFRVLDIRY